MSATLSIGVEYPVELSELESSSTIEKMDTQSVRIDRKDGPFDVRVIFCYGAAHTYFDFTTGDDTYRAPGLLTSEQVKTLAQQIWD